MIRELAIEALHLATLTQSSSQRIGLAYPSNGTDPTEIRSRAEFRYDHQDRQGDDLADIFTLRVDWALSDQFVVRAEVPYEEVERAGPDDVDASGRGDAFVALGWQVAREEDFSVYFGGDVILDTAAEDELGCGRTQIAPEIVTGFALVEMQSMFYPVYQHVLSVGGGDGRDVNLSQFRTTLVTHWTKRFWTAFEPEFVVDWEREGHTGMTAELEFGAMIDTHLGVWVRPGGGLFGDDIKSVYDWNLQFGVRFLF